MLEGREQDGWGGGGSTMLGALLGPGSGCMERSAGDWEKEDRPVRERESLRIGGGIKNELAGLSGSPGGEAEVGDIERWLAGTGIESCRLE